MEVKETVNVSLVHLHTCLICEFPMYIRKLLIKVQENVWAKCWVTVLSVLPDVKQVFSAENDQV